MTTSRSTENVTKTDTLIFVLLVLTSTSVKKFPVTVTLYSKVRAYELIIEMRSGRHLWFVKTRVTNAHEKLISILGSGTTTANLGLSK